MDYWQQGDKVISPDQNWYKVVEAEPHVKGWAVTLQCVAYPDTSAWSTRQVLVSRRWRHQTEVLNSKGRWYESDTQST